MLNCHFFIPENRKAYLSYFPFKYTTKGMTNLLQINKKDVDFITKSRSFFYLFRSFFPKQPAGRFGPTVLRHILADKFGFSGFQIAVIIAIYLFRVNGI